MSNYKPIDDRQVINRAALSNIGSAAGDSLDDILSKINNILSAITSSGLYVAKKIALTSGTTSQVVTISAQSDTSYIVLPMMGNITDTFPQYQQLEVTAKSTTGFTFTWNHPLDSNNYFISFVIPPKTTPVIEASLASGVSSLSSILPIVQPASTYGVIAALQNLVDVNPEFQAVVVRSNSTTTTNLSFDTPTDSINYQIAFMIGAIGQVSISGSSTSVTIPLPVNYNSTDYAVIASIQNTIDSNPQFQPMDIIAQTDTSFTLGWNVARDTGNYLVNYFAISLTL